MANILNTQYSEYAVVESRYSFQTLIIYHGSLLPNQVLNKISYTKIHRCSFRQILLTKLRISIRQTSAQCRAAPAHKQSAVWCRMGFVLTTSRETYGIARPAAWISAVWKILFSVYEHGFSGKCKVFFTVFRPLWLCSVWRSHVYPWPSPSAVRRSEMMLNLWSASAVASASQDNETRVWGYEPHTTCDIV